MKNRKIIILIGLFIIILDQITKMLLINKNITIIPNLLSFSYTENTGVAFGIAESNSEKVLILRIVFLIILILAVVLLSLFIKHFNERDKKIINKIINAIFFILAGAIGNLIDCFTKGYVVDFIKIHIFDFPVFNIADIVIVIGFILLIIYVLELLLFDEKSKELEEKQC